MTDRWIFTPFLLDEPLPELAALATDLDIIDPDVVAAADLAADLAASGTVERLGNIHRALAQHVARCLAHGERPVSIAGDCCASIPVLAGLRRAGIEPSLVWLDAHGDFNTPETSPSGFLGGMPLAMLTGHGDDALCRAVELEPLAEERVILSDARDLDPGERLALESSRVRRMGLGELLEAPLPDGPLWVHLDTDVVDPSQLPAHHYPAPGGPSAAAVEAFCTRLARTRRVAAVSVSSWDPRLDADGTSRRTGTALLEALLGGRP